jgi:hypothetical protein
MDTGRSRLRRQFSPQAVAQTITFNMTESQLDWFEAWVKYDCAEAAGFFTLALNPDVSPVTMRMTKYPEIKTDPNVGFIVSCAVEYIRSAPTGGPISFMRSFPTTLPPPEKSGYTISRPDALTRSNVGAGMPSQRSRFDDSIGVVTLTWLFTVAEYNIWSDFLHNQLLGGIAPFKGWFWNGRGTTNQQVFQFTESPVESAQDAIYKVTATAQIRNIPVMSMSDYIGNNMNMADSVTLSESGSINKALYHDGTYAEFDYTNEPVVIF